MRAELFRLRTDSLLWTRIVRILNVQLEQRRKFEAYKKERRRVLKSFWCTAQNNEPRIRIDYVQNFCVICALSLNTELVPVQFLICFVFPNLAISCQILQYVACRWYFPEHLVSLRSAGCMLVRLHRAVALRKWLWINVTGYSGTLGSQNPMETSIVVAPTMVQYCLRGIFHVTTFFKLDWLMMLGNRRKSSSLSPLKTRFIAGSEKQPKDYLESFVEEIRGSKGTDPESCLIRMFAIRTITMPSSSLPIKWQITALCSMAKTKNGVSKVWL